MVLYFILGFVFISLFGCLLHFVFDWTNHNKYVASFVAVNESTFEHIKIAVIPMLIWALFGAIFLDLPNFAFAVFCALISVGVFIVAIFYTYTYFTKKPILIVDIISFFVAIALSLLVAYIIVRLAPLAPAFNIIGIIGIVLVIIAIPILTYFPPKFFLFKDPITFKYGIEGHSRCIHHEHNE